MTALPSRRALTYNYRERPSGGIVGRQAERVGKQAPQGEPVDEWQGHELGHPIAGEESEFRPRGKGLRETFCGTLLLLDEAAQETLVVAECDLMVASCLFELTGHNVRIADERHPSVRPCVHPNLTHGVEIKVSARIQNF